MPVARRPFRLYSRKPGLMRERSFSKLPVPGTTIKVISGLVSYEEQNALYAQGRLRTRDASLPTRAADIPTTISGSRSTWVYSKGPDPRRISQVQGRRCDGNGFRPGLGR